MFSNTEMKEYRGIEVEVATIGPCYVAHVDRTKGITFHNENDEEVWCLNREEFLPRARTVDKNRIYHEIFTHTINGIENGFVEEFIHYPITGIVTYLRSEEDVPQNCNSFNCAFM